MLWLMATPMLQAPVTAPLIPTGGRPLPPLTRHPHRSAALSPPSVSSSSLSLPASRCPTTITVTSPSKTPVMTAYVQPTTNASTQLLENSGNFEHLPLTTNSIPSPPQITNSSNNLIPRLPSTTHSIPPALENSDLSKHSDKLQPNLVPTHQQSP